jgi:hypothetical protein
MNHGELFLSIKELQYLMGTQWYKSAARKHKAIRERLRKGKKDLTIQEYCESEGLSYRDTYKALRGEPPP